MVLAERQDKRGTFIVLDGKQRLLSLLQFCSPPSEAQNGFALSGLKALKQLNGVTYEEMQSNPSLDDTLTRFTTQSIRTVVVKNWPNEDFLYTVFLRLNSNSVPLSPQELRKALHPGPFVNFADERSSNSTTLQTALRLTRPDFRMRDVEIVIRYYAFKRFIGDYRGDLKWFLDETCKRLNKAWKLERESIEGEFDQLEGAISLTLQIFGKDTAFRKFTPQGYERRLNRAVFDVFLYYFSQQIYADASAGHSAAIREAYENLCVNDVEFLRSLETSTKITEMVRKRFNTWGSTLSKIIGVQFEPPI